VSHIDISEGIDDIQNAESTFGWKCHRWLMDLNLERRIEGFVDHSQFS